MIKKYAIVILSTLAFAATGLAQQDVSVGGLTLRKDAAQAPDRSDYNMKFGDLSLAVRYYGYLEYDDNVNRSPNNFKLAPANPKTMEPEKSFQIANGLDVLFDLPISPDVLLHGNFSAEWIQTLSGDARDGWEYAGSNLLGDNAASITLDLFTSDRSLWSVTESISRENSSEDYDFNAITDPAAKITYWKNTISTQYEYAVTPLIDVAFYVDRTDAWTDEDLYDYLAYVEYTAGFQTRFQLNPDLSMGPFVTFSDRNNHDNTITTPPSTRNPRSFTNNDSQEITGGLAGTWKVGPQMEFDYSVGVQSLDFDNSNYTRADDTDKVTPFTRLTLRQELTPNFLHSFTLSHELDHVVTPEVNFSEDSSAIYNFDWNFHWQWRLEGGMDFTHSKQSDNRGGTNRTYTEYLALTYIINRKATVTLSYERTDQESDQELQEYEQNRLGLYWTYKF